MRTPLPIPQLATLVVFGFACCTAQAALYGPYAADSDTLHLWHMDSPAPVEDAVPSGGTNLVGLLNGAALGDASYPGFGTALNTTDGGPDVLAERNALLTASTATPNPGNVTLTVADTTSGAFTFEAIVWIGFDPAKNFGTTANGGNNRGTPFNIVSAESSANGNRIFQFRIVPTGMVPATGQPPAPSPFISFENVRMISGNQPSIYAAIPTDGPDAIASNGWYHVAVTYNGVPSTEGNIRFYWTRIDASRETANEIFIVSATTSLSGLNPLATITSPFVIGNDGRNRNSNFLGLIDEVRISRVARPANGMLFGPSTPQIVSHPVNETVAVGQPASFSVAAAGSPPLTYQWRRNSLDIPGATDPTYSIPAAETSQAGDYDVVVSNGSGSATSSAATLNVRNPLTLVWAGFDTWNTVNLNWDANGDLAPESTYTEGDIVVFNGAGSPYVYLQDPMHPKSIIVGGALDYTLSTVTGTGRIERNTGITKQDPTTLFIETMNTYTGPTDIRQGTVQVGSLAAAGAIGTGFLTNQGTLSVFNGTVSPPVSTGSGGVTIDLTGNLQLHTNSMSGPITVTGGALSFSGPQSKGAHTALTMNATANPGPRVNLQDVSLDPSLSISMFGTTAAPDTRCTINAISGTNAIAGEITMDGDGTVQIYGTAGGQLSIGNVNSPNFLGKLLLRGAGTNFASRPINVGKQCSVADAATWILESANSWPYGEVAHTSTMRTMVPGALPPASALNMFGGTLDLAGTAQQVAHLTTTNTGSPFATNYSGVIGNSSPTADAVFTLNTTEPDNFLAASIVDSVHGGTRKTALTLAGSGTLAVANPTNTYTGDTLVNGGTLALWGTGAIANSPNIVIAQGATLSATERTDGTFTVAPGQTLKGTGAFTVLGNLASQGTIELNVNKSGSVFTTDRLQGPTAISYGGTLKIVLSGSALAAGDSFKLFDAAAYSGDFAAFDPPSPGTGLAWDTANLALTGTLAVKTATGPDPTPTSITYSYSVNALELQWPTTHTGWLLQAQTNSLSVGISGNWVSWPASATTNRVVVQPDPAQGTVFYRLILP